MRREDFEAVNPKHAGAPFDAGCSSSHCLLVVDWTMG
jgi:hypothetical protein